MSLEYKIESSGCWSWMFFCGRVTGGFSNKCWGFELFRRYVNIRNWFFLSICFDKVFFVIKFRWFSFDFLGSYGILKKLFDFFLDKFYVLGSSFFFLSILYFFYNFLKYLLYGIFFKWEMIIFLFGGVEMKLFFVVVIVVRGDVFFGVAGLLFEFGFSAFFSGVIVFV